MRIILLVIIFLVTGCLAADKGKVMNQESEREAVHFIYNDSVKITFEIPANSIDIMPSQFKTGVQFSDADVAKRKGGVLWLLNRTYARSNNREISGKYSLRFAVDRVSFASSNIKLLNDIKDVRDIEMDYHMKEFGIVKEYEAFETNQRMWIKENVNQLGQYMVVAHCILDENHYLTFVFEYLGDEEEEVLIMKQMAESTLNSFNMDSL